MNTTEPSYIKREKQVKLSNFINQGPFKGLTGVTRADGTFLLEEVGVSIDIGNSETKAVVVLQTVDGPLKPIYIPITLPNTFIRESTIPLSDEVFKNENNEEGRSWRFYPCGVYTAVNGKEIDLSQEMNRHGKQACWDAGVNAAINESSGNGKALPAGSFTPKVNTKTTVLTINLVFGEVYRRISERFGVSVDKFDIVFAKVGAMLPPKEFRDKETPSSGQTLLKKMILSVKNIEFTHPQISKPIILKDGIDSLEIQREGYPGFFYALFERMGKGVSQQRKIYFEDDKKTGKKSSILLRRLCVIIDVGSGTSDILLFQDGKITNSRGTVSYGAKNVALHVQDKLGFDTVSEEDVKNGYITMGNDHTIDISAAINDGRQVVAENIMSKLSDIITNSGFRLDNVASVLVIGGGAMTFESSQAYEESTPHSGEVKVSILPISHFFKEEFSQVAQYAKVLDLPLESYQDSKVRPTDPRMMNVCGMAFILHHRITTESA